MTTKGRSYFGSTGLNPVAAKLRLTDLLGATYARDRQAMMTLLAFAAAAVLLCVMGIYGVLSQRVRERTREIGIRMAMGADAARLVRWVAGAGLRLIAAGLAAGALVAWMATRSLEALLFGVSATDAVTAVATIVVITLLGLAATVVPSWRAAHMDPVVVLRRGGG